jgi:biofilm protein TabA
LVLLLPLIFKKKYLKKIKNEENILFDNCFVLVFTRSHSIAQTAAKEWTKHNAKKWFKKKEWLGGLQLQPHKTINKMEFARQYQVNKVYWDKAFTLLKEHDLQALANGRDTNDSDNVFAIVTQNPTKDYDSTQWESHGKYRPAVCDIR